jgi:hypothetical protein
MQLYLLFIFFQTEKGSALHEAALFGKVDVVRVLLETGSYLGFAWSLSCISVSETDKRKGQFSSQMILSSLQISDMHSYHVELSFGV